MRKQFFGNGALAAPALVIAVAGAAFAQEVPQTAPEAVQQADGGEPATVTADAQTGGTRTATPGVIVETPGRERAPRLDFAGGYESDSNDTSYGFFGPSYNRPLNDSVALRLSLRANHLHYEFANGEGGRTEVGGPGISPGIGLRFGNRNWVQVSAGVGIRDEERRFNGSQGLIREEKDTRVGLSLGADGWYNTTRRSNVHAMFHYGADSSYTWARLAGRHQISNFSWRGPITFYAGAEVVGQGNEDIRSFQAGPLLELTFARTQLSLTARGGYKRSTFDIGDSDSGPYFGVGLWKRF